MLKKTLVNLKFVYFLYDIGRLSKKILKHNLKSLKMCLYGMYKIGIPKDEKENEALKKAVCFCEEIIKDINKDIERYKKYIEKFKC